MTDFYSEEQPMELDQEAQKQVWYQRFAIAMAISFFAPIYFYGFGSGKFIFPNIEIIGKSGLLTTVLALYPLLAAIITILAIAKTVDHSRPIILLCTGLCPFLLILFFQGDLFAWRMGSLYKTNMLLFLTVFSLIGVFVGAKVTEESGHKSGQVIGGVSGAVFMGLILLPLDGMPAYFGLFKLFKSTNSSGFPVSAGFLAITLIAISSAYLFASFLALMNMRDTDTTTEVAIRTQRLVLLATVAFPAAIFLLILFSSGGFGMKMSIFTVLAKYILEIAAIIGLIALSLCELIIFSIPPTVKGSDLFKTPAIKR